MGFFCCCFGSVGFGGLASFGAGFGVFFLVFCFWCLLWLVFCLSWLIFCSKFWFWTVFLVLFGLFLIDGAGKARAGVKNRAFAAKPKTLLDGALI